MRVLGIPGLGPFPGKILTRFREPSPKCKWESERLTFSIGKSGMRCAALWERWELQLFPENLWESGIGHPLSLTLRLVPQ